MAITIRVPASVVGAIAEEVRALWNRLPEAAQIEITARHPQLDLITLLGTARPFMARLSAGEVLTVDTEESAAFFALLASVGYCGIVPKARSLMKGQIAADGEALETHMLNLHALFETIIVTGIAYYDHTDPDGLQLRPVWLLLRSMETARVQADYVNRHGVEAYLAARKRERTGERISVRSETRTTGASTPVSRSLTVAGSLRSALATSRRPHSGRRFPLPASDARTSAAPQPNRRRWPVR